MVDNTNSSQEAVVPESERTPIVTGPQAYQHREARWLHLFLYIITALIFAFFLVLAGRWVYHKVHHNSSVKVTPATNTVPLPPSSKAPSSSASKTQTSTPPGSSTNGASNSTSSSSTSTQPQSPPLPNSGPGNIAAIFIGTSLVVGGLHFVSGLYRDRYKNLSS